MKKILVTGFDPFNQSQINASYEAIKNLPHQIKGAQIITLEVPTSFKRGPETVIQAIQKYTPDYVLCIGQAGGRAKITPEFVGINYAQALIPDNDGNKPMNELLLTDGPTSYFSTLPVHKMVSYMKAQGIPAVVSFTAGTYVCNALLYRVLHYVSIHHLAIQCGFMHVPYTLEQAMDRIEEIPSMNIQDIQKGIELSIQAILDENE